MFELIKNDIKEGVKYNKSKFVILALIVLITCIILKIKIKNAGIYYFIEESFLDYILYIFKGVRYTDASKGIFDNISLTWVIIQIIIGWIILRYEKIDLSKNAKYSLLKFNRSTWWTSKCIWSGFIVILCYAICYTIIFAFCYISGSKISLECSEILTGNINSEVIVYKINLYEFFVLFLLPILISYAIVTIQRMIGFIFKPILGFIFVQGTLIVSILPVLKDISLYYKNNFEHSHFANCYEAYIICIMSCVIGTIVGYYFFRNYDIAGK